MTFDSTEWSEINIFVEDKDLKSVTNEVIPQLANLERDGIIKNFYFFSYTIPEPHLKFCVCRNSITHQVFLEHFNKFPILTPIKRKPIDIERKETQITDGIADFLLSSTGRRLADLLKQELGNNLNPHQVFFVLHYFFNNIGFSPCQEAEVGDRVFKNVMENQKKSS